MKKIPRTIDKLNELFDKYKDKMEGSYHNMLWQLLENGAREKSPKSSAFTLLLDQGLGIADEGKSGYTPTSASVKRTVSRDDAEKIVEDLNKELFGLKPEEAMMIVLSTMRRI